MHTVNHNRIMCFYNSLTQHEHEFEFIIISFSIHLRYWVSFSKYHRIMEIKSNLFKEQSMFETAARFGTVNSCVRRNPNNNTTCPGNTKKLFSNIFKRKNITLIVTQFIVR